MRIVSLLPAATEILFELGLGPEVVGVSHECDHPTEVGDRPRVTHSRIEDHGSSADIDRQVSSAGPDEPLYHVDEELLAALAPDLLITQETCRVCAVDAGQVESAALALEHPPRILSLQGNSLDGVLADVERVAEAAGRAEAGRRVVRDAKRRIDRVTKITGRLESGPTLAAIEWLDPLMASGHWVPELVRMAGGRPVPEGADGPSRKIPWDAIVRADPEYLLVAPCGFTVGRTLEELDVLSGRPGWERSMAVRRGNVYVAESAYFTRPGPRLVDALEILAQLLHPRVFPGLIQVSENEVYRLQPVA